ncbi:MAG: ATP-binding cassette domain-containing protein, partial [Pseudobdellovibrionaceae bacterium]|nr:ATP-binding cassette domain-containing protein [Pseudobdellovibrionaceae bacterium]
VGSNASGKSTLLALLAGRLKPSVGSILYEKVDLRYLPQLDGESLDESPDLRVLRTGRAIQAERANAEDWLFMDDHWSLYAAMEQRLDEWGLSRLDFFQSSPLSGGIWQRLRLALALAHEESFLLLDEPSNHLDRDGRRLLMQALERHRGGCLVASHDRELLNTMNLTLALEPTKIQVYGGPYDFYKAAYDQQQSAFHAAFAQTQQELDRVRTEAQKVRDQHAKKSAQGRRDRAKGGVPRIALGMMKRKAELTGARLQVKHEEKITQAQEQLREKAQRLIHTPELHLDVKAQKRPGARPLLSLEGVQHRWTETDLWAEPLHLQLAAGEHVAILGDNGSGKSTLLQLILGHVEPTAGQIHRRFRQAFLLDQDLGSLPHTLSLLQIWEDPLYGTDAGQRRTIAARLGLKTREASVPLKLLSGGQRLRAALILLATRIVPPDLILLDEPSNHLDLVALECLVTTLRALPSSLIVVTHDMRFLDDLSVHRRFELVRTR